MDQNSISRPVSPSEERCARSTLAQPVIQHEASRRPVLEQDSSLEKAQHESLDLLNTSRKVTGPLWGLVVISILSSTFLFSLDNTIVADIQPAIVREFDNIDKLSWLPVAFLLGAASTNLFWYV